MTLRLEHYDDASVITALDGQRRVAAITYGSRAHKYLSESDHGSLTTELRTYGDGAAMALFDYLRGRRH